MKQLAILDLSKDLMILVLGIIPLLVVADTLVKGLVIGSINLAVLVITCMIISVIQNFLPREIRLVSIILINVTVVCISGLLLQVLNFEISQQMGIYISLIAFSAIVLSSAEEYAIRENPVDTLFFSCFTGMTILFLIIVISSVREYSDLVWLKQPAGAFFVLGILIALFNYLITRHKSPV